MKISVNIILLLVSLCVLNCFAALLDLSSMWGLALSGLSILITCFGIFLLFAQKSAQVEDLSGFIGNLEKDLAKPQSRNNLVHTEEFFQPIVSLNEKWRAEFLEKERKAEDLQQKYQHNIQELEAFNSQKVQQDKTLEDMKKISRKAAGVTSRLASGVREFSNVVKEVEVGMSSQITHLEETYSAITLMLSQTEESSLKVHSATQVADASRRNALVGANDVATAVTSIELVKETVLSLRETMNRLVEKTANIGKVMGVINDVADQTNLLALNAAIEAARAGEAGRGFAVVADEVRKLAEKTILATKEVADAVTSIQEETNLNMQAVAKAVEYTVESAQKATQAGTFMQDIVTGMEDTASQLSDIAAVAKAQSQTSKHVNQALDSVQNVSGSTSDHMRNFMNTLIGFSSNVDEIGIIVHALDTGNLNAATSSGTFITWNKDLVLGLEPVDSQHKQLCDYINKLYKAMQENANARVLGDLLDKLTDYTATHFSDEEAIFSKSAYPNTKKHKELHGKFVAKLRDFKKQLLSGNAALSIDLMEFLKDWLIRHIMGTDTQYLKFVKK